jgi:hypothetical protein
VDVEDVEIAGSDGAPGRDDTAQRERRQVGDRAVGAEARRAAERDQVLGQLAPFGLRPVQDAADLPRGIDGSEDADIVATTEELLGKSLNVPVHAALVGPGIWRDETYAHGRSRVDHRPAPAQASFPAIADQS